MFEVLGQHRRAAAAGAPAQAGHDEERVDLVDRNIVERVLYLVDVRLGDFGTEFVVGADAVALHARLPDQDPICFRDAFEPLEVDRRGVDRDGVGEDVHPGPLLVLDEPVDDLSACLPEADECQFHGWKVRGAFALDPSSVR